MSAETVKQIIGRAVTEPHYRELLFTDPGKALEGYELTEPEASALNLITREKFDAVADELEQRASRAGLFPWSGHQEELAKAIHSGGVITKGESS